MEYMKIADSPLLWLAAAGAVAIVLLQSLLFVRKSLVDGRKMGITSEQINHAVRAAAISSIGPSTAIVIGIVPLLVALGGPITWMRESMIGSVAYELMASGFAASAMGATLGGAGMNELVFANAVWVMSLGSAGWMLFTALFTHKMDSFRTVLAGGRKALVPVIASAAMLGAFSYFNADRIMQWNKGSIACAGGFVVMSVLVTLARKHNIEWLKEWALTISMLSGMAAAVVL